MNAQRTQATPSASAPMGVALCALFLALVAPVPAAEDPPGDGLVPVKAKSFDQAWKRPDVMLKSYTGVLLRPATITFSKAWRARDFGAYGLKTRDVERIRSFYAGLADESFARVLSQGGYRIANAPGENVLEIQLEIVDLYVNAPDFDSDVFARTYVRNFGDMRLQMTLRDSMSGTTLFRSSDLKRGDETGRLEWANSVYNRSEAQRAFTDWARQLQRVLVK